MHAGGYQIRPSAQSPKRSGLELEVVGCRNGVGSSLLQFRDEAVKMVVHGSRSVAEVAREWGLNPGTLGNWVATYRRAHPTDEPPLNISERARLRELERENRELTMKATVPGHKAAALCAREHQ
jgi:transposase-like protein